MAEFPSMPLWTDAYLADTLHLTTMQHGAYLLLLMVSWRNNGRLPDDDKRLARYTKMSGQQWARNRSVIMEFWTLKNGEWFNKRQLDELDSVRRISKARSDAARSKPLKRLNRDTAIAQQMKSNCIAPTPTPTPIEKIYKKDQELADYAEQQHRAQTVDWEPHCQAFMQAYPRNGKPVAVKSVRQAFQMQVLGGGDPEKIATAGAAYASECRKMTDDQRRYIKSPQNFLSEGMWQHEFETVEPGYQPSADKLAHWDKMARKNG